MKKIFCVLAAAALMVSCGGQKAEQASEMELMKKENWLILMRI